ncbi:hypothetical protein BJV78DRAFT_1254542 [Lactifluus subvellereus]|nr:hypothetical protein BJV78DRAFT_1254542 [Lactifluus subvellereus]
MLVLRCVSCRAYSWSLEDRNSARKKPLPFGFYYRSPVPFRFVRLDFGGACKYILISYTC